jgi:hypothetical protein
MFAMAFKCFLVFCKCFRCMLQVFHLFRTYVASVSSVSDEVFHLDDAKVDRMLHMSQYA